MSVGDQFGGITCRGEVNSPWALLSATWSRIQPTSELTEISTKRSLQTVVSILGEGRISEKDAGQYVCRVDNLGESDTINRGRSAIVYLIVYRK